MIIIINEYADNYEIILQLSTNISVFLFLNKNLIAKMLIKFLLLIGNNTDFNIPVIVYKQKNY
jgi:hypothetical protein